MQPWPFCGNPDMHEPITSINLHGVESAEVICTKCKAHGPRAELKHGPGVQAQVFDLAARLWNERSDS